MTAQAEHRLKVRTEKLAELAAALVKELAGLGLSGLELNSVFHRSVSAACVQCATRVSGDELAELALAEPDAPFTHAKLKRLRLGYCGSAGCNSYFYTLVLAPHPEIDWATLLPKVEGLAASSEKGALPVADLALPPSPKRQLARRIAVGVLIILALWVVRHVWSGGKLPLLERPPKYRVDPASLEPGGGQGSAQPAGQNYQVDPASLKDQRP
jgi:hypothetical protein